MAMWEPLREFARMEQDMNKFFDEVWGIPRRWSALPGPRSVALPSEQTGAKTATPLIDMVDKDSEFVLRSEVPGVNKDDMKITVSEDSVSISGKIERKKEETKEDYYYTERAYSSWERTIPLPSKVKSDSAKATYTNGVLELTLPKAEEVRSKKREIKVE